MSLDPGVVPSEPFTPDDYDQIDEDTRAYAQAQPKPVVRRYRVVKRVLCFLGVHRWHYENTWDVDHLYYMEHGCFPTERVACWWCGNTKVRHIR